MGLSARVWWPYTRPWRPRSPSGCTEPRRCGPSASAPTSSKYPLSPISTIGVQIWPFYPPPPQHSQAPKRGGSLNIPSCTSKKKKKRHTDPALEGRRWDTFCSLWLHNNWKSDPLDMHAFSSLEAGIQHSVAKSRKGFIIIIILFQFGCFCAWSLPDDAGRWLPLLQPLG